MSQTLIDQINTVVHGSNGGTITGEGEPGLAAPTATLDVTGGSISASSGSLDLFPLAYGGVGGAGQNGNPFGASNPGTTSSPSGTLEIVSWSAGTDGLTGGAGGEGALATIALDSVAIGSTGSPYAGTIDFGGGAYGGVGGAGGGGGVGAAAGYEETQVTGADTEKFEGSMGGAGGAGGAAGQGGDASFKIDSFSEISKSGTDLALHAYGGQGGQGGYGAAGGDGDTAGATSAGMVGGDGGDGTASLTNSTVFDQLSIDLQIAAYGGNGGAGGLGGGPGGFGDDAGEKGTGSPWTATITYAASTAGGQGGTAGTAVAEMTGDTLSAPTALMQVLAYAGSPGSGGTGGPAVNSGQNIDGAGDITNTNGSPAGATGAAGAEGQIGQITISDNVVTIADGLQFQAAGSSKATITDNTISAGTSLALQVELADITDTTPTLDGGAGGNLVFSGNSLIGGGSATLDVSDCGTGALVDDAHGLLALAGSPGNSMTGFTNFTLDSGATYVAGSGNAQVVFVAPDADTIVLTPGHGSLTIDGGSSTNTILEFQGYGAALDSVGQVEADTTSSSGTTVNVPGDGEVFFAGGVRWTPSASNTTFTVACYATGTRIATASGEVPVEALRVGDRVRTAFAGEAPVTWIGHQHVDCRRHPEAWPVRIRAHAFAPGQPRRDTLLSPDHAVYVAGVLIPVRMLINATTVAQERAGAVTYHHIELARHDVVYAEGLPAESYLDTGNRAAFASDETTRRPRVMPA